LAAALEQFLEMLLSFFFYRLIMEKKKLASGDIKAMAEEKFSLQGAVFNPGLGKGM
jgi:hypothetical protein